MSEFFVLRATLGPPNKSINFLYSESPFQENYIVKVKKIESAQKLMKVSYELIEDPTGQLDSSKMPMTPEETARFLDCAQSTVYKYIKNWETQRIGSPQLEARKDGSSYKISRSDAEKLKKGLGGEQ
jgi:hypothetical protein